MYCVTIYPEVVAQADQEIEEGQPDYDEARSDYSEVYKAWEDAWLKLHTINNNLDMKKGVPVHC